MESVRNVGTLGADERLLARTLHKAPRSKAELAAETGWSRNTVGARLGTLIDSGLVIEKAEEQGERGRPFARYEINPDAASIFVARFDPEFLDGFVCKLNGAIVASDRQALVGEPGAEGAVEELEAMLKRLSTKPHVRPETIVSMVVGVPSPVHEMTTQAWSGLGVLSPDLSEHFVMTVALENDANLMALGSQMAHPEAKSLIFLLSHGRGIGAGIMVSGELHRGVRGWAGEVGHIPIPAAGDTPCSCGNRGCVATIASNPSVMRALSTTSRPVDSVETLRALADAGDIEAIMALRQSGRHIGEAMVGLTVGLAPDFIVVGGSLAGIGEHMIAGMRESLGQKVPSAISSHIRVVGCDDHDAAGVRGATSIGFNLLLDRLSSSKG